jgi:hypothetical protein
LPADVPIDLVSVCFEHPQHSSPDRLNAIAAAEELRQLLPRRRWRLLLVDEDKAAILVRRFIVFFSSSSLSAAVTQRVPPLQCSTSVPQVC